MSAINSIYSTIINQIRKIFDVYEERANQLADDKRKKTGNRTDKNEEEFIRDTEALANYMEETINLMKRQQSGAKNEFLENIRTVQDCLKDIKTLLRKKPLSFKVNNEIKHVIDDTKTFLQDLRKHLKTVKDTKFLCCGTDGLKVYKTPMNYFKIVAAKWRMFILFEPKDGVETFINPKFAEGDYRFIEQVLKKQWPSPEIREVVRQEVVVKEVPVPTSTGKVSPLGKANESIYGINKEDNLTEGLQIYHQEAERNNPQACSFLGKVYEEGLLLSQDLKQANFYYKQAMKGKDSYAHYRYALCLIKGKFSPQNKKDIEEAFNILTQIANDPQNPSPQAITELGQIYEFGHFQGDHEKCFTVKQDIHKAILFYKKARKYRLPRASNNLAVLYLNLKQNEKERSELASIVEKDENILSYLQEAKEAGFSQAYYNLGTIFSKGLLSQKDPERALRMYYEGGIKGDYKCKIKFAYELMSQTSILKEQYDDHYILAIQWLQNVIRKFNRFEIYEQANYTDIAKNERAQALFYLGLFHQHGFGVQKSPKKAINYFIESAGLDYPAAKNKLGDCYFSGYGVKQDRQLAVGQYMEAAADGNSDAMVNLGSVYLNGIPNLLEKNYRKAHQYFLTAHDYDNSDALIHLSNMYRHGLEVDQNEEIARDLLEQAAQAKNATALYMLREQGYGFDQGVFFEHLENQFFSAPKKINIKEVVPMLETQYKSRVS